MTAILHDLQTGTFH